MAVDKWNNTSGGSFSESTNWSLGQAPGASDDADVDLAGSYTISVTSVFAVGELSIAPPDVKLLVQTPGASNAVVGDLTNSGMLQVDDPFETGGGTSLSVSGTLTSSGAIAISGYYGTLRSADKITAAHLLNTGSVTLFGGAGPTGALATFEDTGDAAPTTLLGTLSLNRHAVFDFGAGGGVTSLGAGASLSLNSADSRLTAGGDASGNTALAGLVSNAGTLLLNEAVIAPTVPAAFGNTGTLNLYNGASIGARIDLTNSGMLQVDDPFNAGGGTSVSVSGTLTNSGTVAISGYYGPLTSADTITAAHLLNTGSITLFGGAGPTGALATFEDSGDAAPATLLGTLSLNRHAVFDFGAGGGVTSLGAGANLTLNSADSRLTAGGDASGNTALAGLAFNAGTLLLNGAVIAPGTPAAFDNTGTLNLYNGASIGARTDLTNSGMLQVDDPFETGGGTSLSVSGTLTSSGAIAISGYYGTLRSADKITAAHLLNTGSVTLFGGAGPTGALATFEDTGDAAPTTLLGTLSLNRHAVFDFGAGGGVTSLGAGASLSLNSADSRLTAGGDASGNTALAGLVSNAGTLLLNEAVIAPTVPAAFGNTGTLNLYNGASIGARIDLTNSGMLQVDDPFNAGGGTSVSVSGTLTNSGTVAISGYYGPLTSADTITAAHLLNTGSITLFGGAGPTGALATFEDSGDAAPATLLGTLSLNRHAVFDFGAGGGVTSLGAGANLTLNSADSRLTAGGDASGNTALAGLAFNAGTLLLNGAVIAPGTPAAFDNTGTLNLYNGASIGARTDLTNSGTLQVDDPFNAGGGTSVSVSGTLTNSGTIAISGYYGPLTAADTITAAHLVNTGSISLLGSANGTATLQAATASNTGTVTLSTGSVLSITGTAAYGQSTGTTQVDGTLSGNVGLSGGVLDGTGVVTGSVSTTGGIVRAGDQPSAPGTLTITGGLAESSSSTLEEDLAGTAGASELLVTGGPAVLDGTLQINALTDFTPTVGQSFTVLAASPGQLSGRFATLRYGNTLGNGTYVAVAQGVYLTVAYDYTAGTVTLEAVARPPIQVADPQISPTAIAFGNLHLGDTRTQALTVTNAAVQPADSLDASVTGVTGGVVATGSVTRLAPARSDATDIRVGIATNTVGVKDGQATFALLSDSGGGVVAPLANQSVVVTGSVFRLASPSIDPLNAFVHVGESGTFALTIRNVDPADGYSETLDARVTGTAGRIAASGATALTLAPGASGTSVLISAATGSVGVQSGTVSLAFASDGGTGAGSLDSLGVTALASQNVGVSVTVDNYAVPNFTLRDAAGLAAAIAGSGTATTLDLGTIAHNSGPLVLGLGVTNAAFGSADLLAGTILASGSGAFAAAGLQAFAGLGAGQTDVAPTVTLDTSVDGTFTETLAVDGTGSNASGYSGALSRRTLTITGTVADLPAPTITGLGGLTATAGVATSLGPISVSDANADGSFTVTVAATSGTLSAATLQNVIEQGVGSGTLTVAGSLSAVNAALSTLAYTGTASGSDQLAFSVRNSRRASASASEAVVATPLKPTQTIVNTPANVTLGIGTSPTAISGLSISNPSAQASGGIVSVQIRSAAGLILDETGNSGAVVTGRGTSTLTLTGTVDQINADLSDPPIVDLVKAESKFVPAYGAPFDIIADALDGEVDPTASDKSYTLAVNIVLKLFPLLKAIYDVSSQFDEAEELGDAHIVTFGGTLLTFNAVGEFVLARSAQSGNSFAVQVRTQPVDDSLAGTIITQLAAQLGSDRITIDATRSTAIFVNGSSYTLTTGGTISLSGGQVAEVADGSYRLTWNSGEVLTANIVGHHLDMAFGLGAGDAPGTVLGLAGRNTNPGTNYVLPDGTVLPDTLTSNQLYDTLGNAWRVTDATTLFDYDAGKTTASYTDTSFPRVQLALSDLPADVVAKAAAAVTAAGVTDPNAMRVAEEDYILTGDPSFIAGAESAIGGASLASATITPSAPPPAVLGVIADATTVLTALDGSAEAVFDVYLTQPSSTDTVVSYAVVQAAAGDLDPAAFGTAPSTGSIIIVAGQTTGQIRIAVPAGALGAKTSAPLALKISSTTVPVYAPAARTELLQPVAGPPPIVSILEQTTLGTLTHSGNTYSLDLGAVSYGESLPLIRFALRNTAAAGADQLGGSFTVAPSYGFTVAGAGTLSPIAAGQNYSGLTVALNQNKFGANSETITFSPTDTNPSGYSVPLDPVTLNVSYTLEAPTMAYSQAWGDVHIITYNNLKYDFQAVGEFVLAHSNIASDTFDIQLRLSPYAGSSSVSIITEVALQIGADRVTFGLDRATTVWLNGVPSTVSAGAPALNLAGGTVSMLSDATFKVTWATGETATITNDGRYFNVIDGVPVAQFGQFSGLQGENEGQANDFQLADGTVLPQPLAASTLYGAYANAWRVSQATSLFDYAPGQTTDTYTDRSFPHAPVQLSDLPADVQARAMAAVAATGITDPGIAAAAALDYIATGDPTFIAAAAVAQQQAGGTTVATITPDLPAVPQIGINAQAASVVEAASGPTSVSFTVLLTHASATDTVVTYAVIAPDPSDLDAATFGGILPSGQVTIAAGQTTAALTIVVPQDSLGVDPTAGLEVQIGSTDGTPIFAATALTTITNARSEPGPPAVAQFLNLGAGSLTRSGDTFTLDLGMLSQGQLSPSINLAVANVAAAPADLMSGSFTPPLGSGFILIGNNLPAPIAAGAMYSGIYAQANTGALGAHSETLTFQPIDENASGYQQDLSKLTLVITDDVVAAAAATLLTPSTIVFQNTRLGTAEDQAVSIANTGPAGGAALAVKPVANGNALTTGLVASLAAGAVDTSSIRVGLNTSSAGARGGSVTLQPTSLLAGSTVASADQPSIAVFGSVYRPASAEIVPITAVVHVGDAGALPLGISNADAADGYSEDLRATLTSVSGPFGATAGQSTGAIAAGAASSALAVSFSTAAAAQLTGSATVALFSDGGVVGTGIDGLGTLALPSQTAQLSITVDNYASASLQLLAGIGALAASGNSYTLDLGTVAQGSTALAATLGATNAASGPADLLSGHFAASAANAIGLSGFGDFAGLGAGQTDGGLTVSLDTTGVGTFTRTVTLTSTGSNASGYSGALAPETLTITGTVAAPTVTPPTGPEPGTPAVAQFFNLGAGSLTRSGDTFTLDLGMLAQGQLSPGINLAIGNTAIAPADLVSGSFTPPLGSGFVLTGTNLPAPIAAGTTYSGIYAQADTATLGSHTETLTFQPIDENASGYQQNLSPLTLVITDNVAAVASAVLLTPSTVVFQNVRVGTVEDQAVSFANTNPVGGAALAVKPVASGNALATGYVASLAGGAVDASSIRVGLDTSSAGARGGSVTLPSTSLLAGTTVASADEPTIAVSGSVYRSASAIVAPVATILHVDDVGLLSLGISNADVADGFSEDLRATLTSVSGSFSATAGQITGAIAAGAANSALAVSFSTATAAQLTGSATVGLMSDGGAVGAGVDGLGTLSLPSQTAQLSVTVDNYAIASLQFLAGTGVLTASGPNYTLNLGTASQGAAPLTATLAAANAASGPADLLSGHFAMSAGDAIGLTGFSDFASLGSGQADGGLTVSLDTSGAGTFTRTVTLTATGSNASGYSAALSPETLTITGTVASPAVVSPTQPGGTNTATGSQPGTSTATVSTPVYRFFDTIYGTHLFTQSLSEAQNILANRPDLTEETNNFGAVSPQTDPNAEAVYRFFETTNGTHFFTASYQEYLGLTTPGSSTYRPDLTYEANSTFYEDSIQQTGEVAVYRFFDTAHGTQFLTGSQSEYAGLKTAGSTTFRPDLTPEGIAFYAPAGNFFT